MMTREWVVSVCEEKVDLEEYDEKEFTKANLIFALLKPLPGITLSDHSVWQQPVSPGRQGKAV